MKIEKKPQKNITELPPGCQDFVDVLKNCTDDELVDELRSVVTWNYGKCELYHWIDVLNRFDDILERACRVGDAPSSDDDGGGGGGDDDNDDETKCVNLCTNLDDEKTKLIVLQVLKFSALLVEHSYARHLYSSMESIVALLGSSDMEIVIAVLNLLYVFSKRSNFLSRLSTDQRQSLQLRLNYLAEPWGGKENGFGLAECCQNQDLKHFPTSATTLHMEFYMNPNGKEKSAASSLCAIHLDQLHQYEENVAGLMRHLVKLYNIPQGKQMGLLTRIRLAKYFPNFTLRCQCVQARLQAISILVYSNAGQDVVNPLLYPGFIEELVEVLQLDDQRLVEIQAAALRTLTSVIHLDRNPKLTTIIDATGSANYHGFLPRLVRRCVTAMTDSQHEAYPQLFSTALFSFLYHLASSEAGGDALLACGVVETLLQVIAWRQTEQSHITFVTRAVRIIDLITNFEMGALQTQNGLSSLIKRLDFEVNQCRLVCPFELPSQARGIGEEDSGRNKEKETAMDLVEEAEEQSSEARGNDETGASQMEIDVDRPGPSTGAVPVINKEKKDCVQCQPQRAALIKSILNFLKKAIPDTAFADSIRSIMDSSLPTSLKHIISNSEYYGPPLYHLATDVVTVYVFHEPSLLSPLQDTGLTGVMLNSLILKDIPATKDVLGSLPNMLSALCLNQRGLDAFVNCHPFKRLFKVMLSPEYLPAMKRRRNADDFDDTATNLGSAMDELMRHQPTLKSDAMAGVVQLLEQLCEMGVDPSYSGAPTGGDKRKAPAATGVAGPTEQQAVSGDEARVVAASAVEESVEAPSDDDDEGRRDAEDSQRASPQPSQVAEAAENDAKKVATAPLLDYAHNVVRFVFAILNNNATDDHYREFVAKGGLEPLLKIPSLPNMPTNFPVSPACQSVSMTCRGLVSVAGQRDVLTQCISRLKDVLVRLNDSWSGHSSFGSVLLHELASAPAPLEAIELAYRTPILHSMTVTHHNY
ncbi:E3 ubiquitin-protein ligase HUWE1-like [Oscarella lobularis]|uniref:E3 ubiquitin-protein ligase HUWE1-like n=1 Tax=Oscarella lobularis TaxID=121494 RepID=UPI003313EE50